jgi:hypothetical protein
MWPTAAAEGAFEQKLLPVGSTTGEKRSIWASNCRRGRSRRELSEPEISRSVAHGMLARPWPVAWQAGGRHERIGGREA